MPNRILRDGILSSERIEALDWFEEVFYRRLMSIVDDYGRTAAHPTLLRAALYPMRVDRVTDQEVCDALAACAKAALVRVYTAGGKSYLEMLDFRQQTRSRSKFPPPPAGAAAPPRAAEKPPDVSVHSSDTSSRQQAATGPPATREHDDVSPHTLIGVGVVFGDGDVCVSDARARASEQQRITPEAILGAYPETPNGSRIAALHLIATLLDSGEASAPELLAGAQRFARFVRAGGRSDPTRVMGPEKFFAPTRPGEPAPWAKPWTAPTAKSNGRKPYVPALTPDQAEEAEQLKFTPRQYRAYKGLPQLEEDIP